ncbi:hypothetical protein Esti_001651 [Eimeria stiedai]
MGSLALSDASAYAESIAEEAAALEGLGFTVWGLAGIAALQEELQHQLGRFKVIVLDIDGVLLWGKSALAGVAETLQQLRRASKRIFFLTNTSSKSRSTCAEALRRAGLDAAEEEAVTTAYAAAVYLREKHPEVSVAFGIGDRAMQHEFAQAGIQLLLAEDHHRHQQQQQQQQQQHGSSGSQRRGVSVPNGVSCHGDKETQEQQQLQGTATAAAAAAAAPTAAAAAGLASVADLDPRVGAVVVGWDKTFNYHKLSLACLYLQQQQQQQQQQRGLPFIATNRDAYDWVDGLRYPTNGAQLAAVELVVGRRAECIGKESRWLAEWLPRHLQVDPKETLVVGDRIDTDVQCAAAMGASSLLVLTGCTSPAQLGSIDPADPRAPTFVVPHLGQLGEALKRMH